MPGTQWGLLRHAMLIRPNIVATALLELADERGAG